MSGADDNLDGDTKKPDQATASLDDLVGELGLDDRSAAVGYLLIASLLAAALTLWLVMYPFNFQASRLGSWLNTGRVGGTNGISNILLLMPWGILAVWLCVAIGLPRWVAMLAAIGDGALLSLIAETVQLYLPGRHSSIGDFGLNILGSCCGAILGGLTARLVLRRLGLMADWLNARKSVRLVLATLAVISISRLYPFDFSLEPSQLKQAFKASRSAMGDFAEHLQSMGWRIALLAATTTAFCCWVMRDNSSSQKNIAGQNDEPLVTGQVGRLDRWLRRSATVPMLVLIALWLSELGRFPARSVVMDAANAVAIPIGVVIGAIAVSPLRTARATSTNRGGDA